MLARDNVQLREQAQALNQEAEVAFSNKKYESAVKLLDQSIAIIDSIASNAKLDANDYNQLAKSHLLLGLSCFHVFKDLSLLDFTWLKSDAYRYDWQHAKKQIEKAIFYLNEIPDAQKIPKDALTLSECYFHIGKMYVEQKQFLKALENYQLAFSCLKNVDFTLSRDEMKTHANHRFDMCKIYIELEDYDKALACVYQSIADLNHLQELTDQERRLLAELYCHVASLQKVKYEHADSFDTFMTAIQKMAQIEKKEKEDFQVISEICNQLSSFYPHGHFNQLLLIFAGMIFYPTRKTRSKSFKNFYFQVKVCSIKMIKIFFGNF